MVSPIRQSVPTGLMLVVLCLIAVNSSEAASVFSFQDLGYLIRRVDSRSTGMGGAGRAIVDGRNFSSANPALIASFERSAFSATYVAQRRSVSDFAGQSEAVADGDIGGLRLVLPLGRGTVLGVVLEPVSDVDASVVDTSGSGLARGVVRFKGAGGAQALGLGLGFRAGQKFYVGGRLDLLVVGTINESWEKVFTDRRLLGSDDLVTRTYRGLQPHVGAVFSRGFINLGVAVKPPVTITERTLRESRAVQIGLVPGQAETETDVDLPLIVGGGVALTRSDKWIAALDFEMARWSETTGRSKDTIEIAAGILYRTGREDPIHRQRRHELTAGGFRRGLYFDTGTADQIVETGASFGVTIPFRGSGLFRWVLEGGRRGSTQQHGASETFLRQTFAITGWMN